MAKKTWTIIALSLVIIILIFVNYTGNNSSQVIIDTLSGQLSESVRSNNITERELEFSISTVGRLQDIINDTDRQLKQVLDDIARRNEETERGIGEYGEINQQFSDFIREFGTEE